jgi:hypothetical protein
MRQVKSRRQELLERFLTRLNRFIFLGYLTFEDKVFAEQKLYPRTQNVRQNKRLLI